MYHVTTFDYVNILLCCIFVTVIDLFLLFQNWIFWFWDMMYRWFWGPTVGLHDCLAAFFSADELKGDNMYRYEQIS